jgi:acyl-[acyl-carrier-protein]-phospholipid O-acyltransferase / long-chain-fatty-acid--[acyl-carrier-protein] ligase
LVHRLLASSPDLGLAAFMNLELVPWWAWVTAALVAVTLAYFLRYWVVGRIPLWILSRTLYKLRIYGSENVPATGPALLVCNHVSHIDALLVQAAQKRRIRFLIWAPYTRVPGLGSLLRLANVLPIDSSSGPRALIGSLRNASEALHNGEVICIFAEGGISRTGFLMPFHRGFEQIVKRSPAPIIPVCLDNVWGSIFSYYGGRFFWKWPLRIPYPVCVAFGKPMPPTSTPVEVRMAVQKLSADCSIARKDQRRPVHRQFVRLAARHPFKPCVVDPTNRQKPIFKYGEILVGAKIMTKLLRPILGADKMVGLWLPPSAGGAIANIAVSFLGKSTVNLNYTASPEVVQSAIRQCQIRFVLTSKLFTHKVKLDPGPGVELVYLEEFRKQVTTWRRLKTLASVLLLPGWLQERVIGLGNHTLDDLATVIFSSGSTGDPKGVMLSHGNIAANAESMIQAVNLRAQDRALAVLPFFHAFGYTVTLWAPLQMGASTCFHVDPRQAKEIGELCRTYRCTIYVTTPTFLRFCLRRCEPDDFKTLRILICGAEKLAPSLAREFQEKFGVLPLEGYGCTELSPAAVANVPDWEQHGIKQIGNRSGTIGQPIPGVAAKIVDPNTFAELPVGKEGLLLMYGANVMQGYLGKPELTKEAIRDGWYVTGDIAKYDDDGFITLTDRLARFSKIGGEMVPHQKVEDQLHEILGTSDRHFVVTAVPDEAKGERLVVIHLPLNGTDPRQLWQQLSSRGLPNLWVPRERDFYAVPELPVLGSGKVDLKRIKALALEKTK